MVIAIDGPSGSGKTTTAKIISEKLNFDYCDSGSLYRAVTYWLLNNKINLDDNDTIKRKLKNLIIEYNLKLNKIYINGQFEAEYTDGSGNIANQDTGNSIRLGKSYLHNTPFPGNIDELDTNTFFRISK